MSRHRCPASLSCLCPAGTGTLPGDRTIPGQPLGRILIYSPGCISTSIRHQRQSKCLDRWWPPPERHHCSVRADASLVVGIAHRVETPPAGPEILDHFRAAPTAWRTVIQSVMPHGMTVAAVPDYKTKHRLSPRRSNVRTVPTPCFFRNGERLNAAMQRNTASTRNPPPPRPCPRSTRDHDRGWTPAMGVIENITKLRGLNQYIVSRRNSR